MDVDYIDIGKRIKGSRKRLGITQEKLAEKLDLSCQHLSGIENGKTHFSFGTIINIANALNMSLDELACGSLTQGNAVLQTEFAVLLSDCSLYETKVITDVAKTVKKSLREKQDNEDDRY